MRLSFHNITFLLLIVYGLSAKAQINGKSEIIDTLHETVIYEYDTLYVAPDTIRLADTVYRYQSVKKHSSKGIDFKLFNKINVFNTLSDSWSGGVGMYGYMPIFSNNKIDSFIAKRSINYEVEIHVNYQSNNWRYALGLGYIPIHEQLQLQDGIAKSQVISNGIRDSLLLNSSCISQNYYKYLQLFFNFGKQWGKRKLFFVIDASLKGNLLLSYKALLPEPQLIKISSSKVDRYAYCLGLSPSLGWRFRNGVRISLVTFFDYYLANTNKYPENKPFIMGIGIRLQ